MRKSTVSVDGVALAYEELGSGPPVLLIHGTAARLWGEVPALLAAEHRVIAYDRRGFGASTHEPVDELTRHAADAAALLEALGATPATIVGWSIGGVIALELALRDPSAVERIVAIEPPVHAARGIPRPEVARAVLGARLKHRLRGEPAGARHFLSWALGDLGRLPGDWREAFDANADAIVRELGGGTGEHLDAARLRELPCPVTCLVGDRSPAAFPRAAERLRALVGHTHVVTVPGATHALQLDAPRAVLDAVRTADQVTSRRRPVSTS